MNNQEAANELQYAIGLIKQDGKDWLDERDIPILEAAISALQAQDVPDTNVGGMISKQAAIDALAEQMPKPYTPDGSHPADEGIFAAQEIYADCIQTLEALPSAQPEISRIEQELHGKTPEEQYEFLYWLLLKFGLAYTDSRLAVIEWLRGEKEDG